MSELATATTLPSRWYTDPSVAEMERERIFSRSWLMAARAEEIASPGSGLSLKVAGEPLAIVRDQSGELRAFYNVCRHHAAQVLPASCSELTKLRCPYHGWTYGLDGKLLGTPDFEGVREFSKESNGLTPVRVGEWSKWVWVNLNDHGPSLESFLTPVREWDARAKLLDGVSFHERREYELDCDWKVFVDNYLDGGYHVPFAHPDLGGVLDYSQYRTELFDSASLQSSPLKSTGDATSQVRTGDRAAYWWLWPNFMINAYEGVMDTNLVLPLGPSRCRVVFDFYFADGHDADFRERSMAVAEQVQREDVTVCESVQRGLRSRSYDVGRYSVRREAGMHHFHELYLNAGRE